MLLPAGGTEVEGWLRLPLNLFLEPQEGPSQTVAGLTETKSAEQSDWSAEESLETLQGLRLVPQGSTILGLPRGQCGKTGTCPHDALGSRRALA